MTHLAKIRLLFEKLFLKLDVLGSAFIPKSKALLRPMSVQNKENVPISFVYKKGIVDKQFLERALDFLISFELDYDQLKTFEEVESAEKNYKYLTQKYQAEISMAHAAIKEYGKQIQPNTLDKMQCVYYSLLALEKYKGSPIAMSVISSTVSRAWDGIGEWRH